MERNDAVVPGDGMQSGQNEIGHLFHGGHSYRNTFRPTRPPPFWGPVTGIPFQGYGPRPPFPLIPPFAYGPPVFSVPPPCVPSFDILSASITKPEDEAWLNNWIKSRSFEQSSKPSGEQALPISKVREQLRHSLSILNDLKELHGHLQENLQSLSKEEWNAAWLEVGKKREEVSNVFSAVLNDESLTNLKKLLKKRIGKRGRQKRQNAKLRKDAYLAQLKRQSLHQKADAWLSDMHLAVDRARKDDQMKKEADTVLAEVTRRLSDGRRQTALIEALQKLHQARIQTLEGRGTKLSAEETKDSCHSALVFGKLLAMWSSKMEEYTKEELGLRLMLEESAARQNDMELQNISSILTEWEKCLFGSEIAASIDDPYDMNTLVSIRYAWDQYLVPDSLTIPMASTIPVGWVLPTTPSSPEWQKLLSTK